MKIAHQSLLLVASAVFAINAHAAISYGDPAIGQVYVGAKAGQLDADKPKNAAAYGVYAGYHFDRNLGLEAEYLSSDDKKYHANGLDHQYKAKTYGTYGTYRYHLNNTPFYAKGKLGVAKTKVEDNTTNKSSTQDKTSLAGGIGMGFAQGNFGIEASYSQLARDVNIWNVGVHFSF